MTKGACVDLPDNPHPVDRAGALRCDKHREDRRRWQTAWYMRNGPGTEPDPDDPDYPYMPRPLRRRASKPAPTPAVAAAKSPDWDTATEPLRTAATLHAIRTDIAKLNRDLTPRDPAAATALKGLDGRLKVAIGSLIAHARALGLTQAQATSVFDSAVRDNQQAR